MDKVYVPATGYDKADLMILGESPSFKEVELGKPFVGPSGQENDSLLRQAGIDKSRVWISNVCKYFVTPQAKTGKKIPFQVRAKNDGIDLEKELFDLQNEINYINPKCILALGGTALWALTSKTKIMDYRGSILTTPTGRKVVGTYHPVNLVRHGEGQEIKGYWNRAIMLLDYRRAFEESKTYDLVLPQRNLRICRSAYEIEQFITRYKNHTKPAADIEAGGTCIPVCIGFAFTPDEGISIPLWNTDELFRGITNQEMAQMWLLIQYIFNNFDIIGQYFKYDQDKMHRLGFRVRRLASDTLLKALAVNPELPKNLALLQSIYTREPFYKNEGMYEGTFYDLLMGCARDACVTKEIDIALDKDLDELEQREYYENFLLDLHQLYLDIENEGFTIDPKQRDFLIHKYIKWDEELAYELFQLTGAYINVNAPKQVYSLLFDNLKLPRRSGTGEEELTALLNNQTSNLSKNNRRIVENVLEQRRVHKTLSTYLMALPDYDGKMKTTFYPALETGRSSTGQLDPPIRPYHNKITGEISKKKKDSKPLGMAFQTITKHGDIGQDVRSMFVAERDDL